MQALDDMYTQLDNDQHMYVKLLFQVVNYFWHYYPFMVVVLMEMRAWKC